MDPISFIAIVGVSLFVILTLYFGWRQANPPEENKSSTRTYTPPASSSNQTHINHKNNYTQQQEDLNKSREMLINDVTKINHDYMLELSESDLLDISYSEDPIRAFASKIIPGTPTMATFCLNMENMVNSLLDEMPLSKEKADLVYSIFLEQLISGISSEIIEEIARNYSQYLPSHLYFLKGKINYELGALGVIETIAQQTNDLSLHNSVEYIRRKRGYID